MAIFPKTWTNHNRSHRLKHTPFPPSGGRAGHSVHLEMRHLGTRLRCLPAPFRPNPVPGCQELFRVIRKNIERKCLLASRSERTSPGLYSTTIGRRPIPETERIRGDESSLVERLAVYCSDAGKGEFVSERRVERSRCVLGQHEQIVEVGSRRELGRSRRI